MSRGFIALAIVTASFLALGTFSSQSDATAAGRGRGRAVSSPNMFYNYYVGGQASGSYPAQMYLSPRPTPPLVGHTYMTYQPFYPHEFMYRHHRTYTRVHHPGGTTRTRITYR